MSHELNAAASRVWGLLLADREDEIEESDLLAIQREAAPPAATEGHYDGPREYGWHPPAATEALRVLDNLLRHHNTIHHGECEFSREARAALAASPEPTPDCIGTHDPFEVCLRCDSGDSKDFRVPSEPTPDSGPSKESRLRLSELRDLGVEAGWSDKFYAALAALWQVVKGTEIPAMGTPPHIVMADLIEDIAWPTPDSGLDVRQTLVEIEQFLRPSVPRRGDGQEGRRWGDVDIAHAKARTALRRLSSSEESA